MEDISAIEKHIEKYTRHGRYHDLIDLIEKTIPKINSKENELQLKLYLAEAYYEIRDFKQAKKLAEEILPMTHLDHPVMSGNTENLLGKIYRIYQRYDEAIDHYQKAEQAFKSTNDKEGISKIYHNLGNVYVLLEHFKKAHKYHTKALELAKRLGNQKAIALSHLNIGSLYYQNGEVDKAFDNFRKAKELFELVGDEPNLAATYLNLAETHLLRREYSLTRDYSSKAISLYENQNNVIGQRLALTAYARAARAKQSMETAIETYNKLVNLNPDETSEDIYLELGECHLFQKELNLAKITFEKVLQLPNRTLRGVAVSLDYLARISIDRTEFEEARKIFQQLLQILNKIGPKDSDSIASTQGNLGLMYLKLMDIPQAWDFLEKATKYFKKRKNQEELITLTSNYRDELIQIEEYIHAIQIIKDFLIPVCPKKDYMKLNHYHYEISLLYYLNGEKDEGLQYWNQNHSNKVPFQKFTVSFLKNPNLSQNLRKKLEYQHIYFLKQLQTLMKSEN
ncbi:MAG: tetratricopeptide repeat protein [Candidatus Hodarchaeota archaeon]